MKILLFGGTGFLGEKLAEHLQKKNLLYIYINKRKSKFKYNIKEAKIKKINYEYINKFVNYNKIDLLINLASLTSVELCQKFKKKSFKVHVELPKILSKISKEQKIRIIHISTDHLFNGKQSNSYKEISKPFPLNYYAKTKLLGEKEVKKSGNFTIIRTNFFGLNKRNKNSFSDRIVSALKNKKQIDLWSNVFFSPLHIENLTYLINFLIKQKIKGIFNLSSQKISKYKLGLLIASQLELNKKLINKNLFDQKKFVKRPLNMSLCNKKILKYFPFLKNKLTLRSQLQILKKEY
ncbi:MAG: hypothetical protein CBC25_04795 [Pelagibacteraceae bacterium TMED65]|nr:MAG: hypothetical protein CBC25_04795 [Pelagibacteraceae bacterium TMED65]|tara:strand:- start:232 stop:1110 length:879 start_codon:yes stop_codon:yes gene_type:complete